MVRLLLAGTLLLAGFLYFLLSGPTDSKAVSSGARQGGSVPEQVGEGERMRAKGTEEVPRPLRMRGEGTEPAAVEPQPLALVPAKRIQISLADAFASESADHGVVARERDAMIRTVIADLVKNGVGNAQIRRLECRSQHCALQLEGHDSEALVKLLDALQDDRGFLGKCESMMLSREGDAMSVYLRFQDDAASDDVSVTPTSPP